MSKRLHMNPILKKELVVGSRSMKMSWAIMGINTFLTVIVLIVLSITNVSAVTSGYAYSNLIWLFPILGCVECGLLSLIIPIITSGSISGERERQTLDIMLTTPVTPFSIAVGKLGSAIAVVMMYMISSVPVMAIAFVLGGMNWWALLGLFGLMLYLGIYVGSVGVFCSSAVKKSVVATILTIVIGITILIVTGLILYVVIAVQTSICNARGTTYNGPGIYTFVMMLNPYSPIVDFMMRVMADVGITDLMREMGTQSKILLSISDRWIPCSIIINMLISFLFLKLAARNIAVTRNRK